MSQDGSEPRRDARFAAGRSADDLTTAEALLRTDPAQSAELAREALQREEETGAKARALLLLGGADYQRGRLKEALDSLSQANRAFTEAGDAPGLLDTLLPLIRVERDLGQLDAAAGRCDEALALSRSLADSAAETDALYLRASVWNAVGEYARALECLEQALSLASGHGLTERRGNILNNIGTIYIGLGEHVRALEHLTRANEALRRAAPGTRSEAANLITLGSLYGEMGDARSAREFFALAREVSRKTEDFMLEAAAVNNLANTYCADLEWTLAGELFEEALAISRRLDMRQYEIDNLDGLGQVSAALGRHEQALDAHLEALGIAREISDREGEIDALLNLGRDHLALSRCPEALECLRQGLALAEQIERKQSVYQAHELLSAAYEQAGDRARALGHHREFYRAEKAVFNEESERQTRRLAVKFELERVRHEAEQYRLRGEVTQQAREQAEAEVRDRTQELEEAQLEIVTRLAVAAEYRDDETGEHTRRVGRNAAAIARRLAWPEDEVKLIFTAARLHDVGKIGIGDSVLLKPGPLDAREFEQIRSHTSIGARILSGGRSRLLRLAEEIALSHHERWDGKGYPQGLAGEAIPMSARIVSVADVLDALTHARPYKQAWSVTEALAEIERQAWHQFDPRVVRGCLEVFGSAGGPSPLDIADEWSEGSEADSTDGGGGKRPLAPVEAGETRWVDSQEPRSALGDSRDFLADLEIEVTRARRTGDEVSCLKLALSGVRYTAERGGDEGAEGLARRFGEALQRHLRRYGRVYRLAGDEFAAVLVHVARRDFPLVLGGVDRATGVIRASGALATVSAGIGVFPHEAPSAADLLRLSDQRLRRNRLSKSTPFPPVRGG